MLPPDDKKPNHFGSEDHSNVAIAICIDSLDRYIYEEVDWITNALPLWSNEEKDWVMILPVERIVKVQEPSTEYFWRKQWNL